MNKTKFNLFAALGVAWLAAASSLHAQSIGFNFTTNSTFSGVGNNGEAQSLNPDELAGAGAFAQTNWNNLGRYGLGNFILTNSAGVGVPLAMNWDAGSADSTGAAAGLGTPDGKLMDGFIYSWGPGAATALGNSVYNSSINNKPMVFLSGLSSWYNSEGAEGYNVVVYTTGYSYYEVGEYWVQSVTGSALDNTMVAGPDLSTHIFVGDSGPYTGTYVQATGTSSGAATYGANYAVFAGLTNDAVLIRNVVPLANNYGAGMNGFQIIPLFPTAPTASDPTFSPASTVFAGVPVTITEVATGDPLHPALYYLWQTDGGSGGTLTNIPGATNATLNVIPANSVSQYLINYQVIVTNTFGSSTSSVVALTVNPAVAPFVATDTTPGPTTGSATVFAYVGGSVTFSAIFGGTQPISYLWQSNSVNIPNATNSTLTLANLQLASSAAYQLTATNSIGGSVSTPASLVVLAAPVAPTADTAYPYDVYTNSPTAYWRFGETDDNVNNSIQAYDYSGHGNNGTYGNAAADNQPGPQSPDFAGFETTNTGVALTHNANNSFVLAPSLNLNTNTVTITAWINPNGGQTANNGLFTWVNGSDKAGFGFGGNSSGGMAELGYVWNTNSPSTVNFHSGLYPLANQWSFVALTITPTNSTIYLYYIDGNTGITNLLKSVQDIANRAEPFSGGTTWIGSDTSSARTFNGTIDELAVFGRSLSELQVQDLFLKGIGASGVAPTVSSATVYPAATVYSGQNVRLTATANGTLPLSVHWQSSPNGTTWSDIPGATTASLLVNPLTVGTLYYQMVASNPVGSATNSPTAVTFNALPATPPGLWTVNYQITNNVLSFSTISGGLGHYTGRGILGGGSYWNPLPDTAGAFVGMNNLVSSSDLQDDGATHSGIYCSLLFVGGFSSASAPQPDSSDVGNLINQMVQCWTSANGLQFHGVPDGTYNLCLYGCDGTFADRGTTFVVHDSLNGDQSAGTVNASPSVPLQEGVNFVVFSNVHVSGGTLYVDVNPTPVVPSHNPNTEADFNGAQIQLVSYDVPPPVVVVDQTVAGASMTLSWTEGILQTATNVAGPWTPIYAPSPISRGMTNSAQFYRVQVHP